MSWPFLYFADDRLSTAELASARLDGDVVEVGEAYMPADAVETRELRAASLRPMISPNSLSTLLSCSVRARFSSTSRSFRRWIS